MSGTGDGSAPVTNGRREELLAAARAVLAQNGYERTTVSSIASRANVAQGTFYLYFPSKEALPGALARQLSESLAAGTRGPVEAAPDLESAVSALVESAWETASEHRDVIMIANRGIELAKTFDDFLEMTAPFRGVLEDFLQRFQATGEIERGLDVATTAYVLRDLLDRSIKAKICFEQDGYAEATSVLVRRALAAELGHPTDPTAPPATR
jgi:AcrR family transcriptional regulator